MPRNPPKLVTVLVLLSQLLFAACAPGLAFCQESDGAVSVEWAAAECCTVSSATPAQGAGPRLVEQDACAGCQDSLLDFLQRVETPDTDYLPPPEFAAYDLANALPRALPRIESTARCRAGPLPPHLKTTVLRH
jgi:hypothetical protein